MARWSPHEPGVMQLPSGRSVRGGPSRRRDGGDTPDLTLHLSILRPRQVRVPTTWIAWPDFGLPLHHRAAMRALLDAWGRSGCERVDVTCRGGRGRTGTALACIAVLDGMPAPAAIALVRERYDRRAIETPWQERYVVALGSARATG
jgi:protein-tyrosine phosphatase